MKYKSIILSVILSLVSVMMLSPHAISRGGSADNGGESFDINDINVNIPRVEASDAQLSQLFDTAYFWAGIICVMIIVASGIYYIVSAGNSEGVKKAKNTLMYALVGLVIVILAFAITRFVLGSL